MASTRAPDTRDWLTGRIGAGVRLGLSTCAEMLERLGHPERAFPSIHVAGTNGKGSLCAHLSSMGSRNGHLIGLFTSPHLVTVEERARIGGRPVEPEQFDRHLEEVRKAGLIEPSIHPTYFEATFLASLLAFAHAGVDRAVIETGLGGRLDATRLVEADLCAITTISRDHTEDLGDSLQQIATEKAGIHREGVPLLCLHHDDASVRASIEEVAGADVVWCHTESDDAQGVALEIASIIAERLGWTELETDVKWAGRTQDSFDWSAEVDCRISAAHNEESLSHDLRAMDGQRYVLLLGMTQRHDLSSTMSSFEGASNCARAVVTEIHGGRKPTASPQEIASELAYLGHTEVDIIPDPMTAMDTAVRLAADLDCGVYVTGSVYLVGELLGELVRREGLDLWSALTIHPPSTRTE
ncbi:MAG: Mur ligase family protein [Candidatus Thalassarchaeum sp.]|nr:Mur ligase family protein [Candidatus Thalassarchaeum sp.]MDP7004198.1 Mur ligase family protein [Candidatus Thalassarchaeaceae archaeon]